MEFIVSERPTLDLIAAHKKYRVQNADEESVLFPFALYEFEVTRHYAKIELSIKDVSSVFRERLLSPSIAEISPVDSLNFRIKHCIFAPLSIIH